MMVPSMTGSLVNGSAASQAKYPVRWAFWCMLCQARTSTRP